MKKRIEQVRHVLEAPSGAQRQTAIVLYMETNRWKVSAIRTLLFTALRLVHVSQIENLILDLETSGVPLTTLADLVAESLTGNDSGVVPVKNPRIKATAEEALAFVFSRIERESYEAAKTDPMERLAFLYRFADWEAMTDAVADILADEIGEASQDRASAFARTAVYNFMRGEATRDETRMVQFLAEQIAFPAFEEVPRTKSASELYLALAASR